MISVIMTDHHYIYRRKLADLAGWWSVPFLHFLLCKNRINNEVILPNLYDSCSMPNPRILDLTPFRRIKISGHHRQFLLNQSEIFFCSWCPLPFTLMSKGKGEVIDRSHKQIFADWCSFDFLESEIEFI